MAQARLRSARPKNDPKASDLLLILVTPLCVQRSLTCFGATCSWCYFCLILSQSRTVLSPVYRVPQVEAKVLFCWTINYRRTLLVAVGLAGQDAADVLDHIDVQVPLRRREHPLSLQSYRTHHQGRPNVASDLSTLTATT